VQAGSTDLCEYGSFICDIKNLPHFISKQLSGSSNTLKLLFFEERRSSKTWQNW
jgi:hypothetical protein